MIELPLWALVLILGAAVLLDLLLFGAVAAYLVRRKSRRAAR